MSDVLSGRGGRIQKRNGLGGGFALIDILISRRPCCVLNQYTFTRRGEGKVTFIS